MATVSIRSCNEVAIAGFAELIGVNGISFPRRTIPKQLNLVNLRNR